MERSPELQELISAWFAAFSRGDGAWIKRHISRNDDVRLIGTDPSNWYEGERVGEFLSAAVDELGGAVKIFPTEDMLALREERIGWGVTRATLQLPNAKEVELRWSAVFRQEGDEWRAVQIHGSLAVPDDKVFGAEAQR